MFSKCWCFQRWSLKRLPLIYTLLDVFFRLRCCSNAQLCKRKIYGGLVIGLLTLFGQTYYVTLQVHKTSTNTQTCFYLKDDVSTLRQSNFDVHISWRIAAQPLRKIDKWGGGLILIYPCLQTVKTINRFQKKLMMQNTNTETRSL